MRKKARIQSMALFMIVLVLLLPVAFAQNMTVNQTAAVSGEIPLDASAPEFTKDKYITVAGTTAPNARIEFYVGPTKVKVDRARSDGTFDTERIPLIKKGENDLLVKANVEDKFAQKVFTVFYDPDPPELKLSDIPEFTTKASLAIHGDVTEPVTIKYTSYPKKDDVAPGVVSGLEVREVKKNQATLVWTPSDALDLLEYAVYRDDKRIAVARTAIFIDNNVAGGKEYSYKVSAVDTSCNEGMKSAPKKAVIPEGGSAEEKADAVGLSCEPTYQSLETAVPFDITLALQAGGNVVEIIALDKAGNAAKVEKSVTVDVGPPQFIATNLDTIGTTYIPEITVRGNVSEKATVFVYVNDEASPSHFGLSNEKGGFEIPVKLRQDVEVKTGAAAELDTGVGWRNKIKLKAVDLAGQEAWYPGQQQSKEVVYALCGYGAWLDFDVEEVTPTTVTPRLLMQGIQQVGVPFTLKYIGGQQEAQIAGVVNAVPVRISPDLEDSFDNDKISPPQVWIRPRQGEPGVWDGFVQINFAAWPVDQLEIEGNATEAAIEKAISNWRRGEFYEAGATKTGVYLKPGCLNPVLGCTKLYLEIDIPLKEKSRIYDPQTMQERFEWKTVRQRNCLPLVLEIDQVIPPDVIRKDALRATSNFFGQAIELIDAVLDPLRTFTENMVYLCLGSSAALFLMGVAKRFTCSKIYLAKGTDSDIAEAGLCKLAYGGKDEQRDEDKAWAEEKKLTKSDAYSSCRDCQNILQAYKDLVQDVYQPICDRISCPSAPTVQKYILEKKRSAKDITSKINALEEDARKIKIKETWGVKGKVFSGNSCGFFPEVISTGYTVTKGDVNYEEGQACASDYECRAGLSCVNNVCTYVPRERAKRGEGETCTDDTSCETGLYCNPFNHLCTKPSEVLSKEREGCEEDKDCEAGLKCHPDYKMCLAPTTEPRALSKQGESCGEDTDCVGGLKCSIFGTCYEPETEHVRGKSREGEGCTTDEGCDPGLYCNTFSGTCMKKTEVLSKEGEECVKDSDCESGLKCETTFGKCYVPESSKLASASSSFDAFNLVTGAASTIDILNSFATGSAIAGGDPVQPAAAQPAAGAQGGSTTTAASASAGSNKICGFEIGKTAPMGAGGKIGIKEIYTIYRGDYNDLKKRCTDVSFHPACPLCCGYEYMGEWNSACGVGNFLGTASYSQPDLDTFNELKESAKLAAEKVGRGDDLGGGGIFSIFNALSGFCTSAGNPTPDVVRTGLHYDPKVEEAEENLMQVFVFPESGSEDSFKYKVYGGYLAKTFVVDSALKDEKKKSAIKAADRYSFSSTLEAIKEKDLTKHFLNLGTEKEKADIAAFTNELCDRKFTGTKACKAVAPEVFDDVKNHIGDVEEEYIIKPDAGIFTSVQCICLTAVVAYLEKYRQVAQAIKNCIDVIILTGDGNEGICRAMLSTYVCDLLWEVITCFANKWNAPSGKRVSADAGIGDVLGVLTGAGTDVSNEVKGRYGETAMFNAMFNEKELVHGLCLLAFGFEWNLDVSAMVQQSVESVPVDTLVLGPVPAQSRFIAWNPVTNPRGLTTWEYHFGLMISAGADINARVKLKCSTGFGCRETDGFVGGECDCNKLGTEQIVSINPTCTPSWKPRVSQNELMSYDCSYVVQQGKLRYDKIIFEYDWQDPGTHQTVTKTSEAELNRIGALPPSFCRFDTFSLSFRCKFGEDPSGIKIEKVEPKYEYTAKDGRTEVFAMDEDLDFELSIRQMLPESAEDRDAGVKFLGYKILNFANAEVVGLDPLADTFTIQLKTDGSYKEPVSITAPQEGWKNHFAKGEGGRYQVDVWSEHVPVMNKLKANVPDYIEKVDITATKDGKTETPEKRFVIDVKKDDTIGVYVIKTMQARGSAATTEDNILGAREKIEVGKRYTRTYTDAEKNVEYSVSFTLKSKTDFEKAEQVQFVLKYIAGAAAGDPCVSKTPVTWKATFTSYDADKYGRVTSQKSVDPTTGETQEKTIPFQIVCANKAELKAKGAAVAPGTGLIAAPYWFVEGIGVIDFKDGVATVPEGQHRLIAGTYSKGAVEVVMREKDGESKIYNMQSIPFDDVPEAIQKEVAIIKETGDFFYSFIPVEKGKEYAMKVTFRQPDGKVIDTKEYAVKVEEAVPGAGIFEPPFWVIEGTTGTIDLVKETALPPGKHRLYVGTFGKGIVDVEVQEKNGDSRIYHMQSVSIDSLPQELRAAKTGIESFKQTGDMFFADIAVAQDKEYKIKITFKKADGTVIDSKEYSVKVIQPVEILREGEEPALLVGKPLLYLGEQLVAVTSTDANAPAPIEPNTYEIVTQSGKFGMITANIYDTDNKLIANLLMASRDMTSHGVNYDFSKISGKHYISFEFTDAVTNVKTQLPDKYWFSVGTVGEGPWISTEQPSSKIDSVTLGPVGATTYNLLLSDRSVLILTAPDAKLTVTLTEATAEKVEAFGNYGANSFSETLKKDSTNPNKFSFDAINLPTGESNKLTVVVWQNGAETDRKEYRFEIVSKCEQQNGVCAVNCNNIALPVSGFVCSSNRACCISAYLFKQGKQRLATCQDYGGFCSQGCDDTREEILPWDLDCQNSACCVPIDIDQNCPGTCAPDCSKVYASVGQLDCKTGLTCCAD